MTDTTLIGTSATNSTPDSIETLVVKSACYCDYHLKLGDNDSQKKWGGKTFTETGAWIKELQTDLNDFGITSNSINGIFDANTKKLVQIFQWSSKKLRRRLVSNEIVNIDLTYTGEVTGEINDETCEEINLWKKNNYKATGNLVRVPISNYSRFRRGTLSAVRSNITNSEMVLDRDFIAGLNTLNTSADTNDIIISVNQVLRVQGAIVSGAVVTPATKSQHLIGHAIDVNMVDGNVTLTSANFKNDTATQNAKNFIRDAKAGGLRWGGDFGAPSSSTYDPPHFDLQVLSSAFEYDAKFYLNQRQLSENHPIPSE
jgi:hypothetical protein